MKDAILIQQAYNFYYFDDYRPMLDLTKQIHLDYCNKWNMDFMSVKGNVRKDFLALHGGWAKIELIRMALADGYKYICWVDADAMIVDDTVDLRTGCPPGIGMVLHSGLKLAPHFNVGVMLIQSSDKVKAFVDEWLSRYPGTTEFPWFEQGEANKMAETEQWRDVVIRIDPKWNSCIAGSSHVDNAVIEAWHGMGVGAARLHLMQEYLKATASASKNAEGKEMKNG